MANGLGEVACSIMQPRKVYFNSARIYMNMCDTSVVDKIIQLISISLCLNDIMLVTITASVEWA